MRAREITPLALDSYQRAARVILSNHLITSTYPDSNCVAALAPLGHRTA